MAGLLQLTSLLVLSVFVSQGLCACTSLSPLFPPPSYTRQSSEIWEAFSTIEAALSSLTRNNTQFNTSSYSIEVTSPHSTLWSTFHTAKDKNLTRPGAEKVDETSHYRIASITKVFTVLGILQQHTAGNLSLDDPISKHIPDLLGASQCKAIPSSSIAWDKITLRSLASQLSGIPRDWAQGDLIIGLDDPTGFGLPPIPASAPERADLPKCDSFWGYRPCTAQDLIENLQIRSPLFVPNEKSTYSNIAFELLGIALANVTGMTYEEYIESAIIGSVSMNQTSFTPPADELAVLPKGVSWYWDVDEGVQNPTGGLYCNSRDMSIFLRHVLKEYKNMAGSNINWLHPVSFQSGMTGFYGTPWEIFRTDKLLDAGEHQRTATFFTKGGGLPGYSTLILLVPEYDLGITIFTAGDPHFLNEVLERVSVPLINAADRLAARQMHEKYVGRYVADADTLNSSLTLAYSPTHGLEVSSWISNTTDMMAVIPLQFDIPSDRKFHAQLVPTLLDSDAHGRRGEKWRIALTLDKKSKGSDGTGVWDDWCIADVDTAMYAGKPLNEVVFWLDEDSTRAQDGAVKSKGRVATAELTAFRVSLTRVDEKGMGRDSETLFAQEL